MIEINLNTNVIFWLANTLTNINNRMLSKWLNKVEIANISDYLLFVSIHCMNTQIPRCCRYAGINMNACINLLFLEQQPFQNVQQQSKTLMSEALHPTETTNIKSISQQCKTNNWQQHFYHIDHCGNFKPEKV